MLTEKIQQDQTDAMKSKNVGTLSTLRSLRAELTNKQIELRRELTDEEVMSIIRKQVKQLADAKELFARGGRADLVAENEAQIAVLSSYLPAQMDDGELKQEVTRIVSKNPALKGSNALIGIVMGELKGKADAGRIMRILGNDY